MDFNLQSVIKLRLDDLKDKKGREKHEKTIRKLDI